MNWDVIKGKWNQLTGSVKETWGKLTEDDVKTLDGDKDQLIGKIQERYGHARDVVEKEVHDWFHKNNQTP